VFATGTAAIAMRAIAWFCICVATPAWPAEEEAHVLILNGYDPYLPANLMMDSGMRANLANETARRIVLHSESLDAGRITVESREAELVTLFTKKYGAQRIDVVVTVTKPALDFFKRHGEQLWPGARLVFHGLPEPADEAIPIPPGAVGIINRDDVGGTIDIARRLQPTARRLLVIVGVGAGDLQVERRVRRLAPTGAGTPTMEFISGRPLPELLARVASEPADTIIMFLTQFLDRDGRPYRPPDVAQAMSSVSAAPVYGLYETYVGRGLRQAAWHPMKIVDDLSGNSCARRWPVLVLRVAPCSLSRADASLTRVRWSIGHWTRSGYRRAATFGLLKGRSGVNTGGK
jgi:hypothetical protein